MKLTPDAIAAWIQAGTALIGAGVAAVDGIVAIIQQYHGQALAEEDLNAILAGIQAEAARRQALAEADAGGSA